MRFIEPFDLPCPEGTDYAAIALYMQDLGLKLDTKLFELEQGLNDFALNQPMAIFQNNAPIVGLNDFASFTDIFGLSTLFWNSPDTPPVNVPYKLPSTKAGWYHIGAYTNFTASGTVNTGSIRQIEVSVELNYSINVTDRIVAYIDQVHENGAGEWLNASGLVYLPDTVLNPVQGIDLSLRYQHTNTGSTLTIPTGQCRLWATYLGSGDLIEVV